MGKLVDTASHVGPTVLLPRKGSVSNVFYVDGPIWNVDTVFYTEIDETMMLPRFFYHVMLNEHIEDLATGSAARPSLTQSALYKVLIPVPPSTSSARSCGCWTPSRSWRRSWRRS